MNDATHTNFKNLTKAQQLYVESIREIGGIQLGYDLTKSNWTRKELVAVSLIRQGNDDVPNWIVKDHSRRVGRGLYAIPEVAMTTAVAPGHGTDGDDLSDMVQVVENPTVQDDLVPIVETSL
jgi:hypothetical protein